MNNKIIIFLILFLGIIAVSKAQEEILWSDTTSSLGKPDRVPSQQYPLPIKDYGSTTTSIGDTTYFSSTITDSASGWSSFTIPASGLYEIINFGADTATYKVGTSTPAVTQVGVELPPVSTTGLFRLSVGAIIYFRERANPLYSKLTIKWQAN